MPYNTQPTIRRKILGSALCKSREAKGLTVEQVAEACGVSPATVYRQESGHVAVKVTQIPFFTNYYGVTDPATIERWTEWARKTKVKGPWAASGGTIGPSYRDYAEAEDLAEELRIWELGVIPGLLQTKNYSEAVIQSAATVRPGELPSDPSEIGDLVQLREARKGLLDRAEPPRIWAVIGEAAILTPPSANNQDAHREQIQHLLNLSKGQATIQVLRMSTGLHGCLSGSFTVISFDDVDMVFREGYGDGTFVDEPDRVRSYRSRYERLLSQALTITDTRRYLRDTLATMRG